MSQEIAINIIFWIGWAVVASALSVLALAMFYAIFIKMMNFKRFFILVFNKALEHRLKTIEPKDFIRWHDGLKQRFIKHQKEIK